MPPLFTVRCFVVELIHLCPIEFNFICHTALLAAPLYGVSKSYFMVIDRLLSSACRPHEQFISPDQNAIIPCDAISAVGMKELMFLAGIQIRSDQIDWLIRFARPVNCHGWNRCRCWVELEQGGICQPWHSLDFDHRAVKLWLGLNNKTISKSWIKPFETRGVGATCIIVIRKRLLMDRKHAKRWFLTFCDFL